MPFPHEQRSLTDLTKSKTLKYVLLDVGGDKGRVVFLPDEIPHSHVLTFCTVKYGMKGFKSVISAGFCELDWSTGTLVPTVWGESESIKNLCKQHGHSKECWKSKSFDVKFIIETLCSGIWDYIIGIDLAKGEDRSD